MIMYISKTKIDNLYVEACVAKKVNFFARIYLTFSIKINTQIGEVISDFNVLDKDKYIFKYEIVMKYIKNKKVFHDLFDILYVEPFHYYQCKGHISYSRDINTLQNPKEKFIIEYKMKVSLQNYDEILFHCSNTNLFLLSVLDNINSKTLSFEYDLFKNNTIFVDMIFVVKYIRNRTIVATPLIILL